MCLHEACTLRNIFHIPHFNFFCCAQQFHYIVIFPLYVTASIGPMHLVNCVVGMRSFELYKYYYEMTHGEKQSLLGISCLIRASI